MPRRTKRVNRGKFLVLCLFILFFLFLAWILLGSSLLSIKRIIVVGDNPQKIQTIIAKYQQKKYWNKISQNNLLLLPFEPWLREIKESDLKIREVKARRVFPDTLKVWVIQHQVGFLWQDQWRRELRDDQGKLIKDLTDEAQNKTDIITRNKEIERKTGLRTWPIILENDSINSVDVNLLRRRQEAVQYIWQSLKKTPYFSDDLVFVFKDAVTPLVHLIHPTYGELIFDIDNNLPDQLQTLSLFLQNKFSADQLPQFDYINLSVKGRIIYRQKNNDSTNEVVKKEHEEVRADSQ